MAETEADKKKRILAEKAEAKKKAEARAAEEEAEAKGDESEDEDPEVIEAAKSKSNEPEPEDESEPFLDKKPEPGEQSIGDRMNQLWLDIADDLEDGVAKDQVLGAFTAVQLRYQAVHTEHEARRKANA